MSNTTIENKTLSITKDMRPSMDAIWHNDKNNQNVEAVVVREQQDYLYSADNQPRVYAHDYDTLESGMSVRGRMGGGMNRNQLRISDDGEWVYVCDSNRMQKLHYDNFGCNWDVRTDQDVYEVEYDSAAQVTITGDSSGNLVAYDSTGSRLWSREVGGSINGIAITEDGEEIYVARSDNFVERFNVTDHQTGDVTSFWTYNMSDTPQCIDVDSTGSAIYVGDNQGIVTKVNSTGSQSYTSRADGNSTDGGHIESIAVGDSDNYVYTGGGTVYEVKRLNINDGSQSWTNTSHTASVTELSVDDASGDVFSCSADNSVQRVDQADGATMWRNETAADNTHIYSLDQDGDTVIIGDSAHNVAELNASGGNVEWKFQFDDNNVRGVSYDAARDLIHTVSQDDHVIEIRREDASGMYYTDGIVNNNNLYRIEPYDDGRLIVGYHDGNHRVGLLDESKMNTTTDSNIYPDVESQFHIDQQSHYIRVTEDGTILVLNDNADVISLKLDQDEEFVQNYRVYNTYHRDGHFDVSDDGQYLATERRMGTVETGAYFTTPHGGHQDTPDWEHVTFESGSDPEYFYYEMHSWLHKARVSDGRVVWTYTEANAGRSMIERDPYDNDVIYTSTNDSLKRLTDVNTTVEITDNLVEASISVMDAEFPDDDTSRGYDSWDHRHKLRLNGKRIRDTTEQVDTSRVHFEPGGKRFLQDGDVLTAAGVIRVTGIVRDEAGN